MRFTKTMIAAALIAPAMVTLAEPAQATRYQAATSVYVWATNVNVRQGPPVCNQFPSVSNCPNVIRQLSKTGALAYCQRRGQPISDSGYHSEWWSYISGFSQYPTGWISNVYIRGKAHLDGVPDCTF